MTQGSLRNDLINEIEDHVSEDVLDIIKDFINDMESKFGEIKDNLSGIDIDSLGSIGDAKDIAESMHDGLY
jgi:hypothetical protein